MMTYFSCISPLQLSPFLVCTPSNSLKNVLKCLLTQKMSGEHLSSTFIKENSENVFGSHLVHTWPRPNSYWIDSMQFLFSAPRWKSLIKSTDPVLQVGVPRLLQIKKILVLLAPATPLWGKQGQRSVHRQLHFWCFQTRLMGWGEDKQAINNPKQRSWAFPTVLH